MHAVAAGSLVLLVLLSGCSAATDGGDGGLVSAPSSTGSSSTSRGLPSGPAPAVGANATHGVCNAMLAQAAPPSLVIHIHDEGARAAVRGPDGNTSHTQTDAAGCATVSLRLVGPHTVYGWATCTRAAIVDWKGNATVVEVDLPYDMSVCA